MKKFLIIYYSLISLAIAENRFINNYVFEWGEKDPKVVERYLKNSIKFDKHKDADAAYILGNLYLSGTFLKKDLKKADIYITIAANLRLPEALNSIGDGYYSGDIREKDIKKALYYYEKAAQSGFGPGQFNAGIVLLNHGKTKKDLEKSIFYLDKASKNRHDLNSMVDFAEKYKKRAISKYKKYFKD